MRWWVTDYRILMATFYPSPVVPFGRGRPVAGPARRVPGTPRSPRERTWRGPRARAMTESPSAHLSPAPSTLQACFCIQRIGGGARVHLRLVPSLPWSKAQSQGMLLEGDSAASHPTDTPNKRELGASWAISVRNIAFVVP